MTAHRYQATWPGPVTINFNAHLDNSGDTEGSGVNYELLDKYVLDSVQDVQVQVSDYRELRQFLEGADPNEAYEGVRLIRLAGRIDASTFGKLEDAKGALDAAFSISACRLAFQSNSPRGVAAFAFRVAQNAAPGYSDRIWYCRPAGARPIVIGKQGMGLSSPFTAQLIAFDSKQYAAAESSLALATNGSANVLANAGNVYTMPRFVIVLSGAGSNPVTLTNSTTSQVMTFNFSGIGAGTYMLDCSGRGSFTKADGTNEYSTRLSGFMSQGFLMPGNNTLTWSGATNLTSVTAYWRNAWA